MNILESLEPRRLLSADLLADFGGIYPTDSVQIDGVAYFAADDGVHGKELWRSDGTADGTRIVADLIPGSKGSSPSALLKVGDALLFVAGEVGKASKLYRSDGTEAGTVALAALGPIYTINPAALVNGRYVVGLTGDYWSSDGTADGTFPLHLSDASYAPPLLLIGSGDRALALSFDHEIWSTDATPEGTFKLDPPGGTPHFDDAPAALDGEGFFLRYDGDYQVTDKAARQLWKTDGTPEGTSLVTTPPGNWVTGAQNLLSTGTRLYFGQWTGQVSDGYTLWTSDGTAAGTRVVDVVPDGVTAASAVGLADGRLVMGMGTNVSEHPFQILVTDGNRVDHLADLPAFAQDIKAIGGRAYFAISATYADPQIWVSDGTVGGTKMLQQLDPVSQYYDVHLNDVNGNVVVTAGDATYTIDPGLVDSRLLGPARGRLDLRDGILRIFGTQGDDNIKIYRMQGDDTRFVVKLNGVKRSFATADVSRIYIYGYSGNDNIAVDERFGRISIRSRIWGGGGSDLVYTGAGRDTVYGEAGDDTVNSGRNADEVMGGEGDDDIYGGLGNDTVTGDEGADSVNGAGGADMVGGGDDDSTDHLDGGGGADVIFGHAVYEIFYAGKQGSDPSGLDELLLN